jgi:class 3 adenylate cyclase
VSCGEPLDADATRCPVCGEPRVQGERKLVTVLFADLTGYTRLAASLDPEDVHALIDPAQTNLRLLVQEFGGSVPQVLGDGLMAVFGVPTAHEDDAERAVRAAFALNERVRRLNQGRSGVTLPELHTGVNSGEVMVAGSHEPFGFRVVGDTVNVASRLSDLAEPGRVLVGDRTRDLCAHAIRFGRRKLVRLKGKHEPIGAFEAMRPRSTLPEGHVAPGRQTAFVGRGSELSALRAELRRVSRERRSSVVSVEGDAGLG